jgi:hypothetical protein
MAATGGTLLQLYYSTTHNNIPTTGNLSYGELAINAYDGKLFYKNSNTGAVTVLADGAIATGNLPGGSTGSVVYQSSTGVTSYLTLGSSGYVLTSNGSTGPVYTNPASLTVGVAATANFATSAGSASTATTATTATNLAGGNATQILYQTGANTTSFVAAPTGAQTGYVLGWNGSQLIWVAAPASTSASNISGGAQYQIPFQSAPSTTTFSSNLTFNSSTNTLNASSIVGGTLTANGSITASATAGAINYGTLGYSDVNIFSSYATSVNAYAQKIIQNTNSGSSASVDFIVSNDQGTASTYYGDFGMNSSTYTGTGPFQAANVVYMYSISTDLVIGTKSSNYLRLVTNDNAADSITISPTSAVAFNGNYGTSGQVLQSNGTGSAPTWAPAPGTTNGKLYFFGQF